MPTITDMPSIKAREAIPPEKRAAQWKKTIAGGLIFCIGVGLPLLGYPWYVGAALMGFGPFIASQQLVLGYAKAIAEFVRALGGKDPS